MDSAPLVDSHCHLSLESFASDLEPVLERAAAAGVGRIVVPGIDLATSRTAVQLAAEYPQLRAAVGVHPHHAGDWAEGTLEELAALAQSPGVVAIGEIGLDYVRLLSPRETQRQVFERQLELARQLGLPIIVHNREAIDDLLTDLSGWAADLPVSMTKRAGVLHAFSAGAEAGHKAIDSGFFLGVAGPITFRNADDRRRVTAALPLERLLVETDSPYLSPHPHRGKPNEPARVRLIAERLAELVGLNLQDIADATTHNACTLFGWTHGIGYSHLL